jgi:hypothetical protein
MESARMALAIIRGETVCASDIFVIPNLQN